MTLQLILNKLYIFPVKCPINIVCLLLSFNILLKWRCLIEGTVSHLKAYITNIHNLITSIPLNQTEKYKKNKLYRKLVVMMRVGNYSGKGKHI